MTSLWDTVAAFLSRALDWRIFSDVTVSDLVRLLILCSLVVLGERVFRRFFMTRVLQRTRLEPSLQFAISRIAGYCFIALGVYVSLEMAHINVGSLAIIAGAVGVGLGFGLQNIVSNFVSGLIILAERPVAIGDFVEVHGVQGRVREISLRSTTVLTNDNITIIVPNADFITNSVTNWSHGDPRVRFRIPFGVAYGTDVELLRRLVLRVAAEHPKALSDPQPDLLFIGFGDSALNFELALWTAEMTGQPQRFRSDLYYALEKAFRDNGIEVPFPQHDVHLRSGALP